MNIVRNEIRTGLLVVLSLAALVVLLIYLGAPGVFTPQKHFRIFFENAAGIKPGAQVLLAGRKIGQVRALYSPVLEKDRPNPKLETLIEVQVNSGAQIFNTVKVQITQRPGVRRQALHRRTGGQSRGRRAGGAGKARSRARQTDRHAGEPAKDLGQSLQDHRRRGGPADGHRAVQAIRGQPQ
jgi:hypothetical protein